MGIPFDDFTSNEPALRKKNATSTRPADVAVTGLWGRHYGAPVSTDDTRSPPSEAPRPTRKRADRTTSIQFPRIPTGRSSRRSRVSFPRFGSVRSSAASFLTLRAGGTAAPLPPRKENPVFFSFPGIRGPEVQGRL
ncbi:hypothetical protein NL676_030659 [Syzygium grande]|nr:hypothetical protein NL676_030659 [Syzygium grande]